MKLLVYSHCFYPSLGGMQQMTRLFCRAAVAAGHVVTAHTATPLGDSSEVAEGYDVVRCGSALSLLRGVLHADRVICKGGVSLRAGLAAILFRKPFVIYHEGHGRRRFAGVAPSRVVKKRLDSLMYNRAEAHICASRSCRESKDLPAGAPVRVIVNPVRFPRTGCILPEDRRAFETDFLYVGRMAAEKGILVFADALAALDRAGVDCGVLCAGDGPDLPAFRGRCDGFGHVRVSCPGVLGDDDLARVYGCSRVLVFPSITLEGLGMSATEAMAFGLPVIAARQPVLEESLADSAIYYAPRSSADLAAALVTVLRDRPLRDRLSRRAHSRSSLFSVEKYDREIAVFLSELDQGSLAGPVATS